MKRRRGFSLVELLIVMIVLVLIGTALTRILVNSMRVSGTNGPGRHAVERPHR